MVCLAVTESSIRQQVVFEDIPMDLSFSTPAEATALYKDKYKLIIMEQYVNIWIRQIEEVRTNAMLQTPTVLSRTHWVKLTLLITITIMQLELCSPRSDNTIYDRSCY